MQDVMGLKNVLNDHLGSTKDLSPSSHNYMRLKMNSINSLQEEERVIKKCQLLGFISMEIKSMKM